MTSWTQGEVNALYEELKDVNIEDYLSEDGTHLIGAVATPIPIKSVEYTKQVVDLLPKELFRMFPNQKGYSFTCRGRKNIIYGIDILDTCYLYFISKVKPNEEVFSGKGELANMDTESWRAVVRKFVEKVKEMI